MAKKQNKSVKQRKKIRLLNPAEKGKKFAKEMRNNKHYTNSGKIKVVKLRDGSVIEQKMTGKERAYRAGYLDARKDNANAYKAKKKAF